MAITLNRATANTKILSAEYNENMTDIEDLVNQEATLDGWADAGEAWAYSSVDDPTGIITVPTDATTKYSVGMRISFVNATNTIYGIITAVTATTITFLHEIDPTDSQALHLMANSAITVPKYSTQKAPFGFPLDPRKWSIITTYTSDTAQASPIDNTWYNIGSISIDIPIGVWDTRYSTQLAGNKPGGSTQWWLAATLSTANNTQSNVGYTDMFRQVGVATPTDLWCIFREHMRIVLTTKDTYYLNHASLGGSLGSITIVSSYHTVIVEAICAYL